MKKHGLWIAALLLAIIMVAGEPLATLARSMTQAYDDELKAQLETEALALLEEQFQVNGPPHSMSIQGTIIRSGSARVDVQVSTADSELGQIDDLIHVFALVDGTRPLHVFREPSPSFYLYADQVSPELLPRERLEFWRRLRQNESSSDSGTLAADSVSAEVYKLPWTGGARYTVYQDYNKHFDFGLPVGTQVRASRGGTVYVKRATEDGGCCDPSCDVYNNYVRITHSDGSYGFYLHLKYGSITVNTGDTVSQGDCLALSGLTGYTCGAHLHFNVNASSSNYAGDPYGVAFTEISFVEGSIPTGGNYSPYSQNSTAPCGTTPTPTATLIPPPSNSCLKPLLRYWSATNRKHFYTADWNELGGGSGEWVYETYEGFVAADQSCYGTGMVPLYRFWHNDRHKHFYTTSEDERAYVIGEGFSYEGIVGYVLPAPDPARNTQPLYRCYNPRPPPPENQDDHFYTVLWDDYQAAMANYGYVVDNGIQCYVFTSVALTPTPTQTRTPTSTPTRTRTPTRTPTSTPTRTRTPTSTPTPTVVCTPPPCPPGGTLYCPDVCPGGCGYLCATPTPTNTPVPTATSVASTLGGVNDDGLVNSTDALIILSADVGLDTSQFCPMNCGDVNADGQVDSTDALIVLSYDAGLTVPFPLGTGACPSSVTQPPGCNP